MSSSLVVMAVPLGTSRIGTVDCEMPFFPPGRRLTVLGSDGVDTTGNPIQIEINTNSSNPLDISAIVSS